MDGERRYSAFISYSHADESPARWLHRKLEGYRIPRGLVGQPGPNGPLPKRLPPIFRDREEFAAGGDLKAEIEEALDRSDALIVLCSPRSAASIYVNSEAAYFKSTGRGDRILPVILEGEPSQSFPSALADGRDRLGADFRKGKDERENGLLKILAGLLGVGLDRLVQRERAAQRWRMRFAVGLSLALAGLAFTAVAFGIRSEQLRVRSEANRLAAEARSATEQDQALLLAVAAYRTDPTESARNALFAANSRSPRLVGMTRVSGEARAINILPDGRTVLLVSGETGSPMILEAGARVSSLRPLKGLPPDVVDIAVAGKGQTLVAQTKGNIGFYELPADGDLVQLRATVSADEEAHIAAAAHADVAAVLHPDGRLETYNVSTGALLGVERIPFSLGDTNRLRVSPNGQTLAVASDDVSWLRSTNGWLALQRTEAQTAALADISFDVSGEMLVAAEGVDQGRDGSREAAAKQSRLRCWRVDGGVADNCPTVGAIASPARLGMVTRDITVLYHRDPVSGANVAELWAKAGDKWQSVVLRNDPTFLTGLAASPDGKRILLGTIDGELLEYSVATFGPGKAWPSSGAPLLVDWQASGCRVASQIQKRLVSQVCDGSDRRIVDLEDEAVISTTASGPGFVYVVRPDKSLTVWDSSLSIAFEAPTLPEGVDRDSLSAAADPTSGALIVGDSDVPGLFRLERGDRSWRQLGAADIPVRVMTLNGEGNTIYVGREDTGAITAIDATSGARLFETLIPNTQFAQHIVVAPGDKALYVSVFTNRHSLYKLDARTGAILSDDFNRFSGPARVLAVSPDQKFLVVRAVGRPDGPMASGDLNGFVGVDVLDAQQLLPTGLGFRTRASEWRAAFAPDSTELWLASNAPFEAARVPLDTAAWVALACEKAGRELSSNERDRFDLTRSAVCPLVRPKGSER